MSVKRKWRPRWMRRHVACPECGLIVDEDGRHWQWQRLETEYWDGSMFTKLKLVAFNCPRCEVHLSIEEFWEANQDKWTMEANLETETAT